MSRLEVDRRALSGLEVADSASRVQGRSYSLVKGRE